jgi:wobble nucleotide-excising tRNase
MNPGDINFCYGSNGSGKTTLSNYIGSYIKSSECNMKWKNNVELPVLTYNKKFIEANFGENPQIAGIFTLGEESTETRDFIEEQKKEIEKGKKLLETYSTKIQGLTDGKAEELEQFEEACWAVQQAYGDKFREALVGYRRSKKAFAEKCLEEFPKMNEGSPLLLQDIEKLYLAAFSETNTEYPYINLFDVNEFKKSEICTLLEERISGSNESPIGTFIEFLQNSDWIKIGIGYAKLSNGRCPYCQQLLPVDIQNQLEHFFDETYEIRIKELKEFSHSYSINTGKLLESISNIIENPITILEYELLKSEYELLHSKIQINEKILYDKIESPATMYKIESLLQTITKINDILTQFNISIKRNNEIVKNQSEERKNCQNQIWQFFTYNLRETIKQFKKESKGKDAGITTLQGKLREQEGIIRGYKKLIEEKEETLTSVLPTVTAINGILKRFGFDGFDIAENRELKGTYKIVRPDGTDANKTLSEGEYNFITFLYFYHLVYGSHEKIGLASEKVVVIDDPISSLDSNVLFIISTLVRQMLFDCKDNKNGIKQIFVLTHNVYFHKEVTYIGSRESYPETRTAFWIIKKMNNKSEIIKHAKNPIKTSYELLWSDLKDQDRQNRATIFNTLRRILEYYFNVIGGLEYEKCINQFDGEDKIVCKALISCINDGSHFISDDFVMCFESDTIENYLRVFKLIFEKMDHESHYKMMMAIK